MSLHTRDCSYCGTLVQWRATDAPPMKCASCGAPPTRAKASGPSIRIDMLYGFKCVQPEMAARLVGTGEGRPSSRGGFFNPDWQPFASFDLPMVDGSGPLS